MKKIICALLALIMALALTSTALAADVSASYNNGQLTVSTSTDGWFRIAVDGVGTDRSLTPRVPTLTFAYELSDGTHRVSISSDIVGAGSTTIEVVNGVSVETQNGQNTPKATAVPEVKEHNEHIPENLPMVEPTCTQSGFTEGTYCTVGKEILSGAEEIPALGHRYAVVSHNDTTNFFECMRCGNKIQAGLKDAVQNRYGNIILDEKGKVANYKAAPDKTDDKVMTFTLDKAAEQAVLTLDNSLIMQIIRDGFKQVELVNGNADAIIDLYQITPSWFNTTEKVENYIFTFDSEAQVTVETLINGEKLTAETYAGITTK